MRIAVWHNLPSGGGKRALYDQVRGLIKQGHQVEAWCPSTASQDFLPLSTLTTEHVLNVDWNVDTLPDLRSKIQHGRWNVYKKSHLMKAHAQECAATINAKGFDVLLGASCLLFNSPHIGRYISIPKLLYLQEPGRIFYEAMPEWPWLPVPTPKTLQQFPNYLARFMADIVRIRLMRHQTNEEQQNARAFDRIAVNSLYSRESILRAYGLSSNVCYLGVDTEKFNIKHNDRQRILIGTGAIIPPKNIEFLIRAISMISSNYDQFIWVGNKFDAHYLEYLKTLAQQLNVKFCTKIMVSDEELIDLYNKAWVMLYAPRLEPFGYSPLEAGACALPTIGVAEAGVRETIKHEVSGLLVSPNPTEMAKAIDRLLTHPQLTMEYGTNARINVETNWSLQSMVHNLEDQLTATIRSQIDHSRSGNV